MRVTSAIAMVLVIIGALNWLLIGLFAFDLVAFIFGTMSVMTRIVYSAVGLAGIWMIFYSLVYRPLSEAY
ncbi:MAG: DUF378 domain-containing protein [Clostridia bacterium]|nr:DUF378 domain-containing protein [Clostridia bacterium]